MENARATSPPEVKLLSWKASRNCTLQLSKQNLAHQGWSYEQESEQVATDQISCLQPKTTALESERSHVSENQLLITTQAILKKVRNGTGDSKSSVVKLVNPFIFLASEIQCRSNSAVAAIPLYRKNTRKTAGALTAWQSLWFTLLPFFALYHLKYFQVSFKYFVF